MGSKVLKFPHRWAGLLSDKWCAEPRSEPDSGNPTVRDRRAALRNVASHAYGVLARALNFEPDNRTHASTGGDWKRNPTASPRQPPTQPSSRLTSKRDSDRFTVKVSNSTVKVSNGR